MKCCVSIGASRDYYYYYYYMFKIDIPFTYHDSDQTKGNNPRWLFLPSPSLREVFFWDGEVCHHGALHHVGDTRMKALPTRTNSRLAS